jgi:hypothetical protein
MRGIKLTVAIITIILSIFLLLGGLAVAGVALMFGSMISDMLAMLTEFAPEIALIIDSIPGFAASIQMYMIIIGIVMLVLGIVYLILGIKFCSRNRNLGIAIALLILYALGAAGFMFDIITGIVSLVLIGLLIAYIIMSGRRAA